MLVVRFDLFTAEMYFTVFSFLLLYHVTFAESSIVAGLTFAGVLLDVIDTMSVHTLVVHAPVDVN